MADRADVRDRLRTAPTEHQPDRERMLARVYERGPEGERPPGRRPPRPARLRTWSPLVGAAAGLVGVLAVGGIAVGWVGEGSSTPSVRSSPDPGRTQQGGPADGEARTSPAPDPAGPQDRHLTSSAVVDPGSNAYWAQSNVTVRTEQPLDSLTVELRIALTGGVESTGAWRTLPAEDFVHTVHREPDALVYRWTLKEGASAPPGKHVFAGQYNHAEGERDATGDGYLVRGDGPAGPVAVRGGFH